MLLRVFPTNVSRFLYDWTSWIPGKVGIGLRIPLVNRLCKSCGANVALHRHVHISNWENLIIGDNVQIHPLCYLDALGGISIGSDVSIAHGSSLLSFEHTWQDEDIPIKYNPLTTSKIVIGSDVWIGCGVRILAGAEISRRSVFAAGSIALRGRHKPGLYVGVPAKFRKKI